MAPKLTVLALLLTFGAAVPAAQSADINLYKIVKHSDEIGFQGRTVNYIRHMHPVDPHGLRLGKIRGVLVDDNGLLIDKNKVAGVILDLKGKIAKNKMVIVSTDDLKMDPTNRKQIIVNKTVDQLRAMPNWGDD